MENISKLLERFSKILNRDSAKKEAIAKVVQERARVSLDPESFSLKDGILQIDTSSVYKNEISLKEEVIKDELKRVYSVNVSRIIYK